MSKTSESLAALAKELGAYRNELIEVGFKPHEALQLCLAYQEIHFLPTQLSAPPPTTE